VRKVNFLNINTNLNSVLDLAKKMTEEKLHDVPSSSIYLHALAQIDFIKRVLMQGRAPTQEERDFIDIGLMAIKELDDTEPEFSGVLCELSYQFKKLPA
jgi:hypothetical protein